MNVPPGLELANPNIQRGQFRAVLFDFDGTLSLIREGWPQVMVGMMVERLREQSLDREPEAELRAHLDRLVMAQNGAPTIRQMEVFVSEVLARGGAPADSWEYLRQYVDRLMEMVHERWEVLESGRATPAEWVVPGVHGLLENLRNRGLPLFVASGTDYAHVSHEAEILGVEEYFPSGINAPRNNDATFRKATVIASIVDELGIAGSELLSFGDGMVETTEVKRIGGVAIGVASSEYGSGTGIVNASKRTTLLAAGADAIVADYTHQRELIRWLWGE